MKVGCLKIRYWACVSKEILYSENVNQLQKSVDGMHFALIFLTFRIVQNHRVTETEDHRIKDP